MQGIDTILAEGLRYHQAGQWQQAEACYQQVLSVVPDHVGAMHSLGALALQCGRNEEAIDRIGQAIARKPQSAAFHCNISGAYLALDRAAEAVAACRVALRLRSDFAPAHFNLGNGLRALGQLEEAADAFRQAMILSPNYAEAVNNLGLTLLDLGRPDEAEVQFRRAIQIRPDYAKAHNNLAMALSDLGRLDEAVAAYEEALRIQPGYAEAYCNLATILHQQGELDRAVECCHQALALCPESVETLNNLGNLHQARIEYEQAIECYRAALAKKPHSAEIHNSLATVLKTIGRYEPALQSAREAIRISPNLAEAWGTMASVCDQMNRVEEAREAAQTAVNLNPANALGQLMLARCDARDKRHQEALDRLLSIPPQPSAAIQYEIATQYDRLGQTDEAFAHFVEANRIWEEKASTVLKSSFFYDHLDRCVDAFSAECVRAWTPTPPLAEGHTPVFLIGFARSGTTLLEQILSAHPRIETLSEQPAVATVRYTVNHMPGKLGSVLASLSADQIRQLRNLYFDTAGLYLNVDPRQSDKILVDKFPLNTGDMGLIVRLFPDARFIMTIRHPYDVCLSCFMQNFGFNDGMKNFTSLERTVDLYVKIMDLRRQYTEVLHPRQHIIRYEDLLEDFDGEIGRLLQFVGVPWDEAVRGYADHARACATINTPSYNQVVRPLHKEARYRWRRYVAHLAPVLDRLVPYADEFGYPVT
ncbi:MAG: tetratricopeptide repeat protein [Pirellulales bacterium]|nr:tetratricopeptide repeat protein [Pirellulales bacterium]